MAYGKFKDFTKRTQTDKVLRDKAFKIASNPRYDGYQRRLASADTSFLIKNLLEGVLKMKLNKINNLKMNFINQLLEHFKNQQFILRVHLACMQLISKYNKVIRFLLCVIDNFY